MNQDNDCGLVQCGVGRCG